MSTITDTAANTMYRFADGFREPCEMLSPIEGFGRVHVETLAEAIKTLLQIVPRIKTYFNVIQDSVTTVSDGLTWDESASIALYTMEWSPFRESVYYLLNTNLRDKNRAALKPWFPYLKLLITALQRLPHSDKRMEIYRGVHFETSNDQNRYKIGEEIIWWGFSSCSADRVIAQKDQFVGENGLRTLLIIDCFKGIDIKNHSHYKREKEVLLLPATTVKVIKKEEDADGLCLIYLEEIPSLPGLLENIPTPGQKRSLKTQVVKLLRGKSVRQDSLPNENGREERRPRSDNRSEVQASLNRYKPNTPATLTGKLFGDQAMELVVQELVVAKRCSTLILRENNLTHIGAQIIAPTLSTNQTLVELYIVESKIGVDGVKAIAEALANATNTNLKKLSLNSVGFQDEGLRHIATMLKKNKTLSELHLPQNKIGDVGFQDLITVLTENNETLRVLSLEWNRFGSTESFQTLNYLLRTNKNLTSVNVESNKWSSTAIGQLRITAERKENLRLLIS